MSTAPGFPPQATICTSPAIGTATRSLENAAGPSIEVLVEARSLAEMLYVLPGRLDHIVNGESYELEPGMVGVVRPGDSVVHRVVSSKAIFVFETRGSNRA